MTALERAQTYAAIFIGVGAKWPEFLPVDASLRHGEVFLDGVRMRPIDGGGWELEVGGRRCTVRPAEKKVRP